MPDLFFHESAVEELLLAGTQFRLRLSGVATKDGDVVSATILVDTVSLILVDGKEVGSLVPSPGDGELLSLDVTENGIKFIVEWEEYSPRRAVTHSYLVSGQAVAIRVDGD